MADAVTERPSGAFESIKADGFVIESNDLTADQMRAELGIQPAADGDPEPTPAPTRAAKPRSNPNARMLDATAKEAEAKRERDEARAELDRLRAEVEELRKPKAAPTNGNGHPPIAATPSTQPARETAAAQTDEDPEPKLEQFAKNADGSDNPDPYTAWVFARNAWGTRQEIKRYAAADAAFRRAQAQQQQWESRAKDVKDFEKRFNPNTPVHRDVWPYIQQHPNGPEIAIYLSEHQDDAQRLAALHPITQIGEIGEIVATLKAAKKAAAEVRGSAPTPQPVSQAKPLIKPLSGQPAATEDDRPDDELSDAEHEAKFAALRRRYR